MTTGAAAAAGADDVKAAAEAEGAAAAEGAGAAGAQGGTKKGKASAKDKEEQLLKAKRKEIMDRAGNEGSRASASVALWPQSLYCAVPCCAVLRQDCSVIVCCMSVAMQSHCSSSSVLDSGIVG